MLRALQQLLALNRSLGKYPHLAGAPATHKHKREPSFSVTARLATSFHPRIAAPTQQPNFSPCLLDSFFD
jgi:hypothetical protein